MKNFLVIIILVLILIASIILAISTGPVKIPAQDIISTLFNQQDNWQYTILTQVRLPRILLALTVGGALALAGVLLQAIFRNPLVEPYTLGISGGASLGVCLIIVLGVANIFGTLTYPIAGFVGALIATFVVYGMSVKNREMKVSNILVTGIMVSFVSSSLLMLAMALARAADLQSIVFWTMGALRDSKIEMVLGIMAITIICFLVSLKYATKLNAFSIGEDEAFHIGVDIEKIKRHVFILASILTGLSVSVAGVIGFVGLIIPHIMRGIVGHDHRILIPSSFLFGGCFLLLSDTIARTIISPIELPVGVITGIIGGIIFIYSINKRRVKF